MFGYACNETPELMPTPIMFAHRLGRELTKLRKSGRRRMAPARRQVAGLRPLRERPPGRGRQRRHLHPAHRDAKHADIRDFLIEHVIKQGDPRQLLTKSTQFLINPTGRFVVGGPEGDSGLTGRKIIVDTYGGWGRHGGGAFSGKDPVQGRPLGGLHVPLGRQEHRGLGPGRRCELQVAYAIGYPEPVSVYVDTMGTGKVADEKITGRAEGLQLQARRHHQAARPPAPDLPLDHQLRPLRQARASPGSRPTARSRLEAAAVPSPPCPNPFHNHAHRRTKRRRRQDFQVKDLSLADWGRKESPSPSTRCPA
jgi:hypothetical protein